jgi:hypothetical protein
MNLTEFQYLLNHKELKHKVITALQQCFATILQHPWIPIPILRFSSNT